MAWAAGTLAASNRGADKGADLLFGAAVIATALMIGLRSWVGGDWTTYLSMYDTIALLPLDTALGQSDPGYAFLNWGVAQLGFGVVFVNVICGAIFMWGLSRFARAQPNPWLTVLVGVPYFIIIVAMGYTRQATAIGILLGGLANANEKKLIRLLIAVSLATLLHKSAVLALPLIGVAMSRRNPIAASLGAVAFIGLYFTFLDSSTDALMANYVEGDYDSQGAGIRVTMDIVAAILFFIYRKKMNFTPFMQSYWNSCALLSFACGVALFIFPSTSGIDRFALFLIPLQLAVLGRLPYIFSASRGPNGQILLGIMIYLALVQFTWLNFAKTASRWVPYTATPFVEDRACWDCRPIG